MMKIINPSPLKKALIPFISIISLLFPFVTNLFSSELYDLCYQTELLRNGKILFTRYRNPLLDPVLRTYEIHSFDPHTGKISFLQKYQEKIYIPPVISRDKSIISYHSLIEGTDYLVTRNIEIGKSTRLRFDTGGYFVALGLDYDNDTVVSVIKRGENKQALYLISNRASTIKRILSGVKFIEAGFFYNGNPYFVEIIDNLKILGIVRGKTKGRSVIAEGVNYIQKAPNGDGIIYSQENDLYLYRVYGNESIILSRGFDSQKNLPLFSYDGSTLAVIEKNTIYIVNIPSGDIMYYLSMDTEDAAFFLTDFTFYIIKENKVFYLEHKKPGQSLQELYKSKNWIGLLSVSQNDRYLIYQNDNKNEIIIFDRKQKKHYRKEFSFTIQEIIPPELENTCYIIARSYEPEKKLPVKELYLYNFKKERLFAISTVSNTDIRLYLRNE